MGQANAADIRRVNVALQKARLNLLAEQNKLRHAVRALSALVGIELEGSQFDGQLDGQSLELDFGTLLSELFTNSPEMIAARCKLQSDKITVQREIVEPIPNVNLEGGVGYNFDANETVAVAGVSLKLPIFDRNQGTIQQARADLARQCAELERLQGRLKRDLAMQFETYQTATQHITQYRQTILPELKETYRLLLESYKNNRTDWNEVLLAQGDYFMARSEYLDWLSNWRQSEVLIDGMLLHGGLMAADGPTPAGHIDAAAKPR
jgi:outer membrane protein TolC